MNYPEQYIQFLIHFHGDRDLFECHEILEEYWKQQNKQDDVWVALIQLAVGLYHYRRGNRTGAQKMLQSAMNRMNRKDIGRLGLDYEPLQQQIQGCIQRVVQGEPYADENLPIADPILLEECKKRCHSLGWEWQGRSGTEKDLIHRHTLRDRSLVIQQREIEKQRKEQQRKQHPDH